MNTLSDTMMYTHQAGYQWLASLEVQVAACSSYRSKTSPCTLSTRRPLSPAPVESCCPCSNCLLCPEWCCPAWLHFFSQHVWERLNVPDTPTSDVSLLWLVCTTGYSNVKNMFLSYGSLPLFSGRLHNSFRAVYTTGILILSQFVYHQRPK